MPHRPARRARTVASILSFTGALLATAALAPVAGAAPAAKKPTKPAKTTTTAITPTTPVTPGSGYLALGDSFTFGYMESQVVPAPDYTNAGDFTGYPEMLGTSLHLNTVNASCPGETSSSFISTSAASNGCENAPAGGAAYRSMFPLHTSYSGSQLAYAVKYLKSHPKVRLVSLQIGGNDLLYCQETTADGCTSLTEEAALVGTVQTNLRKIMTAIRKVYNGQVVYVGYYPPTAAYDAPDAEFQTYINQALKPYKVEIDNPTASFVAAAAHSGGSLCTAGLETQLVGATTPCGIHPSYAGQALYAQTVLDAIKLS
jgi:lysophospholipase L1-like esterase